MKQHVQAKAVESQTMQNEPLSHRKHLSHTEKSFFTDTQAAPQSKHSDSTPVIEAIERSGCRKKRGDGFLPQVFCKGTGVLLASQNILAARQKCNPW